MVVGHGLGETVPYLWEPVVGWFSVFMRCWGTQQGPLSTRQVPFFSSTRRGKGKEEKTFCDTSDGITYLTATQ